MENDLIFLVIENGSRELLKSIDEEIEAMQALENELPVSHFLDWCIDELTEFNETEDVFLTNFERKGQAVHGFSFSDHDGRLDLFITDYRKTTDEFTLYKSDAENSLRKLEKFFINSKDGKNILNKNEPAYELVEIIQKAQITLVRMFLLTNGKTTIQKADDIHTQNVLFQKHYWDISRFSRVRSSGQTVDDTDIFTKDFGKTILLVLQQITVIEQMCLYKLTCVFFPEIF